MRSIRSSRGLLPRAGRPRAVPVCERLEGRVLLSWSLRQTSDTIALAGSAPVTSTVVADFNGDGIPDVAAAVGREIWVMDGRADGTFAAPRVVLRLRANAGMLAVADLNGDGRMDLVAAQNNTERGRGWVRSILNTAGGFRVDGLTRVAGAALGVVVGRLDADAHPDVLGMSSRHMLARSRGALQCAACSRGWTSPACRFTLDRRDARPGRRRAPRFWSQHHG
jgi:hypothetical protein